VSSLLVAVGLWVRLSLTETPVFKRALASEERVKVPTARVFTHHFGALVAGTLIALATFVLFYLMTVFALAWGTGALGYDRARFLELQLFAVLFFAATIPISAVWADRVGRRKCLLWISAAIAAFGFALAPLFESGMTGTLVMLCVGLALMGLTYGPIGTVLSELFPTTVRYTGASLTFNLAGIFGASLAPYIATWLAKTWSLSAVGLYLAAAAGLTIVGLLVTTETRDKAY